MTAAGIAIAAGGGRTYKALVSNAVRVTGKATKFSAKFYNNIVRSIDPQLTFTQHMRWQRANLKSISAMGKAAKLSKAAKFIRRGSLLGGAALVGAGAVSLARGFKRDITAEQSGAIGVAATTSAFTVGAFGKAGVRHLLSKFFSKAPRLL